MIGLPQERKWMQQIGYGNAATTGAAPFWVAGDLAISAIEQLEFLQKLYRNALPFDLAHQRLVKDLMIHKAGSNWILRAKTGWTGSIGWWVGWVEHPDGAVFFAMNIDTPNRMGDIPKRQLITRQVLRSIDALPE
jgi:beta-lactamase class D